MIVNEIYGLSLIAESHIDVQWNLNDQDEYASFGKIMQQFALDYIYL